MVCGAVMRALRWVRIEKWFESRPYEGGATLRMFIGTRHVARAHAEPLVSKILVAEVDGPCRKRLQSMESGCPRSPRSTHRRSVLVRDRTWDGTAGLAPAPSVTHRGRTRPSGPQAPYSQTGVNHTDRQEVNRPSGRSRIRPGYRPDPDRS